MEESKKQKEGKIVQKPICKDNGTYKTRSKSSRSLQKNFIEGFKEFVERNKLKPFLTL